MTSPGFSMDFPMPGCVTEGYFLGLISYLGCLGFFAKVPVRQLFCKLKICVLSVYKDCKAHR